MRGEAGACDAGPGLRGAWWRTVLLAGLACWVTGCGAGLVSQPAATPEPRVAPATARPGTAEPGTARPAAGAVSPAVSSPVPPGAYLTGISVRRYAGHDRVVFRFAGGIPRYTIRYVTVVRRQSSGRPVRLSGRAFLRVVFHWASTVRQNLLGPPGHVRSYHGPRTVRPRFPGLLQLSAAGQAGGYLTFGAGLRAHVSVHAFTRTRPDRVVIDLGHPPAGR